MASVRRSANAVRQVVAPPGADPPRRSSPGRRATGPPSPHGGPVSCSSQARRPTLHAGNDLSPFNPTARQGPRSPPSGGLFRARQSLLCRPLQYLVRTQEFSRSQSWGCGDERACGCICAVGLALLSSLVAGVATADSPNPTLTPGAASGSVTQVDVGSTICRKGYASEVRSVSTATKHQVFAEYGIPKAQQHLYVIDHLIPLEVGGANVPQNLWPEPKAEAKVKDKEENALHGDVCRGDVTLADAQQIAVGPVDAGLTAAVTAKGAAKRGAAAADAAAQQAQQLQQQQIAAYIAAVNQQKLAAYLAAVAAQKAAQERRQQQQSSERGVVLGRRVVRWRLCSSRSRRWPHCNLQRRHPVVRSTPPGCVLQPRGRPPVPQVAERIRSSRTNSLGRLFSLTPSPTEGHRSGRAVDRGRGAGRRAQRHRARVVAREPARDEGDHRRRLPRARERVRGRGRWPRRPALPPDARVLLRHLGQGRS